MSNDEIQPQGKSRITATFGDSIVAPPSSAVQPSTLGRKRDRATIPNEKIPLSEQDQIYMASCIARTWAHYTTRLEEPLIVHDMYKVGKLLTK